MVDRIIKVLKEKNISGYQIREKSNGLISQVSADKIKNGKTQNPRKSTLELLVKILCTHYNVSKDWLINGKGEIYLDNDDSFFLEKHGVRFEAIEIIDHFVQNKDEYFKRSEYLKLFVKDLVEKGVTERLNELKEYLNMININSKN
ncbi:hypothetical protein U8527_03080 [Kordia algicida OT-1]|uniref:Uncharacterized protein n=1 Tax=Kordia algicida OT-1 TaxID=391587 RepID=A9DNW8_9FLAO|nr:hypothetical protein [Kordia algicida]EDP97299.1 hypothetical protein KAOT1_19092 [Kordia algicida OT-1]